MTTWKPTHEIEGVPVMLVGKGGYTEQDWAQTQAPAQTQTEPQSPAGAAPEGYSYKRDSYGRWSHLGQPVHPGETRLIQDPQSLAAFVRPAIAKAAPPVRFDAPAEADAPDRPAAPAKPEKPAKPAKVARPAKAARAPKKKAAVSPARPSVAQEPSGPPLEPGKAYRIKLQSGESQTFASRTEAYRWAEQKGFYRKGGFVGEEIPEAAAPPAMGEG